MSFFKNVFSYMLMDMRERQFMPMSCSQMAQIKESFYPLIDTSVLRAESLEDLEDIFDILVAVSRQFAAETLLKEKSVAKLRESLIKKNEHFKAGNAQAVSRRAPAFKTISKETIMKNLRLTGLSLLLCALLLLPACTNDTKDDSEPVAATAVEVVKLAKASIQTEYIYSGQIKPIKQISVASKVFRQSRKGQF